MDNEISITAEYEKDRYQKDENKIMWRGVALMTVFAILDWELFQWFYTMLQVKH
jgi:hypothetical protein